MRRLFAILILWLVLAIPATLRAQEQLTVLYPSPAGSWMIPVIAKEAKYFEKEGLAVEYVRVGGSIKPERLVDFSLVDELERSGFVDASSSDRREDPDRVTAV